jgi:hypothetical protein
MKIEYPQNFSLDSLNNTYLWRYIGIHQFIDLLLNRQVYFSRLDSFEDGVEGLTWNGINLKYWLQGEPLTSENINPSFDSETQTKLIEQDKADRQAYLFELTSSQQTQFASCWFLGNRESISMWKIYSDKNGVAIKFKARELTDTLVKAAECFTNTDFEYFTFGPVQYKNIWPFDLNEAFDGRFNAMKKDNSYSHENEFRFITVVPLQKKGAYENFKLPIGDLSTYDIEIITNPFMKQWEFVNLKRLLKLYNLETKISVSKMDIHFR